MLLDVFGLVAGSGNSMLFCFCIGGSYVLIKFCGDVCCRRSKVGGSQVFCFELGGKESINDMALCSYTCIEQFAA